MVGEFNDFRLLEPASPENLIPGSTIWPYVLGGLVVLAALICWLVLRHRKAPPPLPKPIKQAYQLAMTDLSQLGGDSIRDTANQVSWIVRKFLSLAANDPALYETHEEFISRQDSLKRLSPESKSLTESLFNHLVSLKYAPNPPAADVANLIADAKSLIETLYREFQK